MIGVDIVDFHTASLSPHWDTARYRNKVYSSVEQAYVLQSSDRLLASCRLWSMKEAAYKIYNQQAKVRELAPIKLVCTVLDDKKGRVRIGDYHYYTDSFYHDEYIFSVCMEKEDTKYDFALRKLDHIKSNEQSLYLHRQLKEFINMHSEIPIDTLSINYYNGKSPQYRDRKILDIGFSISHHNNIGVILFVL